MSKSETIAIISEELEIRSLPKAHSVNTYINTT